MRILFTSDWHLGKIIENFSMLEDQSYALNQIKDYAVNQQVDLIVIAGDIYDRTIPPKEAINLFDRFINEMVIEHNIKVIVISGNHDSYERLAFGSELLKKTGLYIGSKFDGTVDKVILTDEFGPINFYLIPFISFQEVREILKEDKIIDFHHAYLAMLGKVEIDQQTRNILITHSYVGSNTDIPELSDSERTLALGGVSIIDTNLFDGFDYVALGHIHKPQQIGSPIYRYSGSPLKYSFSEVNHHKSITIVDFLEKGSIKYEQFSIKPLRDVVIIKGYFDEIINNAELIKKHENDYVKVSIDDSDPVIEPVLKLKAKFPFLMGFEYSKTKELLMRNALISAEQAEVLNKLKGLDFIPYTKELFIEFAKTTSNYLLTLEDEKIINKILTKTLMGDEV